MHDTRTIELPVFVLINMIRRANLGEPHTILAVDEQYVPARFEAEARRVLDAELARAGIRPDGDFRKLLTLIQCAGAEYYGWIDAGTESSGVLAAARGRDAALLVRRGEEISLRRTDPDRLARSVVSRLPGVPPARGPSISVRAADFSPPNPGAGAVLRPATAARPHEARRLDELLRQPRLGGAYLYAAARDHKGTRRRSAGWLTVLDLARQGRWLIYLTAGGDRAINAVPGTPATLAAKLTDLLPRRGHR